MAETKKFTEQEIAEIKTLQQRVADTTYELGRVQIDKQMLKDRESELISSYERIIKDEQDLVAKLSSKYGVGTLDLSTGEFVPQS